MHSIVNPFSHRGLRRLPLTRCRRCHPPWLLGQHHRASYTRVRLFSRTD
eukprot:XP_001706358.1 Hypothetical protein GL50803_37592 [Giardia lamblia ATCC 50803]